MTSPLSLCTPVILVMPWARGPALMDIMPNLVSAVWRPEVLTIYNKDFGMPVLPTNTGYWLLDVRDMAESLCHTVA